MNDKHAQNWYILFVEDDEEDYIQASNMLAESRQRKIQLTWAATF